MLDLLKTVTIVETLAPKVRWDAHTRIIRVGFENQLRQSGCQTNERLKHPRLLGISMDTYR